MADSTGIEWCDATWSVVTGCERESPGCARCYAEQLTATRLKHQPKYLGLAVITEGGQPHWTGEIRLHPDELHRPLALEEAATDLRQFDERHVPQGRARLLHRSALRRDGVLPLAPVPDPHQAA